MQKGHKIKAKKQRRMVVLGKVTKYTLGYGNKRQEHNGTPQITNIEKMCG